MSNAAMEKPRILPFGKFKDQPITSASDEWLTWFLSQPTARDPVKAWCSEELRRRGGSAPAVSAPRPANHSVASSSKDRRLELIEAGYRLCMTKALPQFGGSEQNVKEVMEAKKWLSDCVSAAQKKGQ